MNILCIVSGWYTLILNPGIVYNDKNVNNNEPKIYCNDCRFLYPHLKETLEHCCKCGVCIYGIDHHCDVIYDEISSNKVFVHSVMLLFRFSYSPIFHVRPKYLILSHLWFLILLLRVLNVFKILV